MVLHLICWCLASFNIVVAGLSIQVLQPMTAETPSTWSTTLAVCKICTPNHISHSTRLRLTRYEVPTPAPIYLYQNVSAGAIRSSRFLTEDRKLIIANAHKEQISFSSSTPLNDFTNELFSSTSGTYQM
jgi:hypothetical protein